MYKHTCYIFPVLSSSCQESTLKQQQQKNSSNGVLLRRHGSNIGDEDYLDNTIGSDEDEGTLLRKPNTIFKRSSSRVNGTSEIKSNQVKSGNGQDQQSQNKESSFRVTKFLEKGKASLSRSKSELGEQHKKMISHLSKSRNEITEQNKKLLANLSTRKFIPGQLSSKNPKSTTIDQEETETESISTYHHSTSNGQDKKLCETTHQNGTKLSEPEPLPKDLDGLMKNLGIDVMNITKRTIDRSNIQNNYENLNGSSMSQSLYTTQLNNHHHELERHLENDYGEFEYIDEAGTLTRTLKTNGESVNCDEHRKSMFSFSDEVFEELEKTGTLKMETTNAEPKIQQIKQQHSSAPKEIYETYGAWRQRKYSGTGTTGTGYVSQYYSYNNNNTTTSSNNTSEKLSALIADQTLLLRHHKRRQKEQQKQQQPRPYMAHAQNEDEQLQSLIDLQQQLTKTKEQLLEQGSSNIVGAHPLRRCSSLSQTSYEETEDLPPQIINGTTSPALSSNSPWLSSNSSRHSTCENSSNGRYLYRGKFQPSSAGSNNNNSYKQKSPWQLRSNLSSFARRRRGSSTSLHNFSDDEDSNGMQDININASKNSDSISLADSAEVMSRNHR